MKGRKPNTPLLQVLHGRNHKSKAERPSPPILPELGPPPTWFSPEESELWTEAATYGKTWLKAIDARVLELWCVHFGLFRRALRQWDGQFTITRPSGAEVPHPLLLIARQQSLLALRIADVLVLTPLMRQRLKVDVPKYHGGWEDIAGLPNSPA